MAENLASSTVDRILNLIDDALDDGPCWRCQVRAGSGQTGLCDPCGEALRAETGPRPAVPVIPPELAEAFARELAEAFARLGFMFQESLRALNEALARTGPQMAADLAARLHELGAVSFAGNPTVSPPRKPPRTCPNHGLVMDAGLCRRCLRSANRRSFAR